MTKMLVCAAMLLLASHSVFAQDTLSTVPQKMLFDTTFMKASSDTAVKPGIDTTAKSDTTGQKAAKDSTAPKKSDNSIKLIVDKSEPAQVGSNQDFDNRWFISPLLKFQLQDFGMLEKNHFGYLSNANNLSLLDRGNASIGVSAYKNITSRLSASADIGMAKGHVTSTDVLVATTLSKTYNLLNLTAYYHLLPGRYKLQPFVSVGINDLINDASYLTAPIGVGMKFHSRKIAVVAQAAYGYGVTKNNASNVMYNLGIYIPVNFRKKKPDNDELSANGNVNSLNKDSLAKNNKNDSSLKNNKDSAALKNGIVNNVNIVINMDSVLKARNGKNGKDGKDAYDDDQFIKDDEGDNPNNGKKGLKAFNYDDFSKDDFEMDTIDGKAVVKFVVYFEFNQYDLNSSAFTRIDKVIGQLRKDKSLLVSIKGYTDNVGTQAFNLMLSKKRAQIVYDYMNSRGISSERMTARFFGKENPVADNSNPNTAWLNRRAEMFVYEKGTIIPNVYISPAKYLRK